MALALVLLSVGVALGGWKTAAAQPAEFPPRPPAYQFDPSLNPPQPPAAGDGPYGPAPRHGHSIPPGPSEGFGDQQPPPPAPYERNPYEQNPYERRPFQPNPFGPRPFERAPYGPYDPHGGMNAAPPSDPRSWQEPGRRAAPQLLPVPPGQPSYQPPAQLPGQPPGQRPGQPPAPPVAPLPPPRGDFSAFERPLLMPNHSWIYIEAAAPREIHVHDIVTIIVKEISESTVDSRFNRQRRGTLLAQLREFVRFGETGNLTNAASDQPTIDGNLNSRLNSTGRVIERELMAYRIAATVVDVLPNGNLVLEARKIIESNGDLWEHTLTGMIRSVDINRDNTCLSENIANLRITKHLTGRVHDSTGRPWGMRLLDRFFPF